MIGPNISQSQHPPLSLFFHTLSPIRASLLFRSLTLIYHRYHPAFVILNGSNPEQILQRAEAPFLLPSFPWEQGIAPYTCNVARVVFLEAAVPTGNKDEFTVYFGGSDAVVGKAVIKVTFR